MKATDSTRVTFTLSSTDLATPAYNPTQNDRTPKTHIELPADIIQKILLHLPVSQLLNSPDQRKRFGSGQIDSVRFVNKSFYHITQQIMATHPQIFHLATTQIGYNDTLSIDIARQHHVSIPASDLPITDSLTNNRQFYLEKLPHNVLTVGQASAHHLDKNARLYCINTQHDIALYPISQENNSTVKPIAVFTLHEANFYSNTVICVNKSVMASGDKSGRIWVWHPASHNANEEQLARPTIDSDHKKDRKPLLQRFSQRFFKQKKGQATQGDITNSSTTPIDNASPQISTESNYQPWCYQEHQYPITSMVTIDHTRFLSSDEHGVIKLWNINEARSIQTWEAENHFIHTLSWSNGHCRLFSTVTEHSDSFFRISEINGHIINVVCHPIVATKPNTLGVLFHLSHQHLISIVGRDHESTLKVEWLSDRPNLDLDVRIGTYHCDKNAIPFFTPTGGYGFFHPKNQRDQIQLIHPLTQTTYHDDCAANAIFP